MKLRKPILLSPEWKCIDVSGFIGFGKQPVTAHNGLLKKPKKTVGSYRLWDISPLVFEDYDVGSFANILFLGVDFS
jgi:hypothetical protein